MVTYKYIASNLQCLAVGKEINEKAFPVQTLAILPPGYTDGCWLLWLYSWTPPPVAANIPVFLCFMSRLPKTSCCKLNKQIIYIFFGSFSVFTIPSSISSQCLCCTYREPPPPFLRTLPTCHNFPIFIQVGFYSRPLCFCLFELFSNERYHP